MRLVRSTKRITTLLLALIVIILGACKSMQESGPVKITETAPTQTSTSIPPFKVNIPDKALWKNYLNVSVEAPTGVACRLTYVPPMGITQEMDTIANESGMCSWRWKISEEEGKGPARLIFTVDGTSETHFIEVRRSF